MHYDRRKLEDEVEKRLDEAEQKLEPCGPSALPRADSKEQLQNRLDEIEKRFDDAGIPAGGRRRSGVYGE